MADNIREIAIWLGLLGVPTIFGLVSILVKAVVDVIKQMRILMAAQKAQMRSQLMSQYYEYEKRGFIYSDEQQDWENQYQAYHKLVGENGVLDAKREKLLVMQSRLRN